MFEVVTRSTMTIVFVCSLALQCQTGSQKKNYGTINIKEIITEFRVTRTTTEQGVNK